MKTSCSQCGAELTVMETEYYLRCPYCEASIMVTEVEDLPFIVVPSAGEEAVRRMFPAGAIAELELRYFPYADGPAGPVPVFSQPFPELEEFRPPAGDRKVFSEELAGPDQIIPMDDDILARRELSRSGTVLHPFWLVMLKLEGYSQGVLVDGVSGRIVGDNPLEGETAPEVPSRTFLLCLLLGLPCAALVYWLLHAAGTGGSARAFATILAAAAGSFVALRLFGEDGARSG
ncbi:MAG: hypothetical protein R6U36_06330 [Candidatus Fermentibacteraceae bacterium]